MAANSLNAVLETLEKSPSIDKINTKIISYESPHLKSVMSILLNRIVNADDKTIELDTFFKIFGIVDSMKQNIIIEVLKSTVKAVEYNSIHPTFPQGYCILSNFGTSSTELNSSIFEYLYTNLPFYSEELKTRCYDLLRGFQQKTKTSITVFHGTNFPIDSRDAFKTFAFFSTSIDYRAARTYGKNVYAIHVPEGFPYVSLCDKSNKQILLPIGTSVKVLARVQNVRFCVVNNSPDQALQVIGSLLDTISCPDKPLNYIAPVKETNNDEWSPVPTSKLKGSSRFFSNRKNIIKQIGIGKTKDYTYIRCLNEILACELYTFFHCKTLNPSLVEFQDKFALQSEYFDKINYCLISNNASELLRGYIVDCVLANWDVGQFRNVGVFKADKADKADLIRTDVGGALAYRARGEFKISFFNNYDIKEHITMLSSPLIKSCVKQVSGTPEKIADLMFEVFVDEVENINQKIDELSIKLQKEGWPEFFTTQVLSQVKYRIEFYSKTDKIKKELIAALGQLGGTYNTKKIEDEFIIPSQDSGSICGANSIIDKILHIGPKCKRGGKLKPKKIGGNNKMKIISWNVNGIRAVLDKDKDGKRGVKDGAHVLQDLIDAYDPDVLCLQETKCPADFKSGLPFAYGQILASKTKKGYSGVAVFSKVKPINVFEDFPMNEEGRVLVFEFEKLYVVNTYTPNSKPDLSRLEYRVETWETAMRDYINKLQKKKPVVYVSDFNVAATELDIHTAKGHERAHGFTIEERTAYADLLRECDMIDSWRHQHPGERKYTWYSNFAKARERNKGWRIDAAVVSKSLARHVKKTDILSDYFGSDHIPVYLELSL